MKTERNGTSPVPRWLGAIPLALILTTVVGVSPLRATIIPFDVRPLNPGEFYNGSDAAGGFTEGGIHFNNDYNPTFGNWSGFAISQVNDTTTAGFGNQYASYTPGTGFGGSGNYGVVFADPNGFGATPTVTLPRPSFVQGLYVNNSTYSALSMLQGDAFSKKFGGADGSDPDWFKLRISGKDDGGTAIGVVDFYLADYRFADDNLDYVVADWAWVDLTGLGAAVSTLEFQLDSTDVGQFGVNTPAYFAIDNLTVIPEPTTVQLLGFSFLLLVGRCWYSVTS